MPRALVIVDIQNDYFPGGRFELVGPERAAERAAHVLSGFRSRGEPVFHMQHVWEGEDAEFFARGIGWVPVDLSSAVLHDKTEAGLLFFGHDPGDFLTLHVNPDLVVDSVHFGRKEVDCLQGIAFWVTGSGSTDGQTIREDWKVTSGP